MLNAGMSMTTCDWWFYMLYTGSAGRSPPLFKTFCIRCQETGSWGELLEKNKASIVARTAGQRRTVASHEDAPPAPTHVAKKSAAFRVAVGLVWFGVWVAGHGFVCSRLTRRCNPALKHPRFKGSELGAFESICCTLTSFSEYCFKRIVPRSFSSRLGSGFVIFIHGFYPPMLE